MGGTVGAWFMRAGTVAETIVKRHVAGNTTTKRFNLPVVLPSSPTQLTGTRLISVELDYEITVLALTSVSMFINRITRGDDGAVAVVDAQTFTYDSNHDTDLKRSELRPHRMTLTLTNPPWIDNDQYYLIRFDFVPQINSQFWFAGMFANYYWRD